MENRRDIILSVYLPTLILSFAMGMYIPVMPLYASDFGISYGLIGIVLAAQGFGNLLGDVPAGILLGRLGHKWSMMAGVAILGLAMLATGLAHTVFELVVYGLLAGVGNAMWNISRHAYMTDLIPLGARGRATATFGGINRFGTFLGPFVGGAVGKAFNLRVPFYLFAVCTLVVMVVAWFFINESVTQEQPVRRGGVHGHVKHLAGVVRQNSSILTAAGSGVLLAQMIRTGRRSLIPLFAADMLGLDVQQIGLILALSSAVDTVMFYPAGYIMDRFGRKFASVPSFLIQGIGMALVPLSGGFGSLLFATIILGFGNGIGSGTMLTLGSDLAPKEAMGEFLGIWRLIGDTGQSGAPMVVGGVADILGLSMATYVIALSGLAAAGVLALFVPETLRGAKRVSTVNA